MVNYTCYAGHDLTQKYKYITYLIYLNAHVF